MKDPVKKAICNLAFKSFFNGETIRDVQHYTIEKIGNDSIEVEVTVVEGLDARRRSFTITVQ